MKPSAIKLLAAVRDAHSALDRFIAAEGWRHEDEIKPAYWAAVQALEDFKAEMEEDPGL